MQKIRHIILALLLLLGGLPLHAQWSGSLEGQGGFGWLPQRDEELDSPLHHARGQLGGQVTFRKPTLVWTSTLNGSYTYKETDTYRGALSGLIDDEKPLIADAVIKFNTGNNLGVNTSSRLQWTPATSRSYETWLQYKFGRDWAENITYKEHASYTPDTSEEKMGLYMEKPNTVSHMVGGGFRTTQWLGAPGRVLKGELTVERNLRDQTSIWVKMDASETDFTANVYRITPKTDRRVVSAKVQYLDSLLKGGPFVLHISPGVRVVSDHALDHNSGATAVDGGGGKAAWRDSVRLREDFNFLALRVEPYFAADFSWNKLKAHVDYAPQLYARRLTDDIHNQSLQIRPVYPVGDGRVSWTFSPQHKITLRNSMSVRHPDYIQICWYERQGAYMNQVYRGKESLRSVHTSAWGLDYEFRYKRFVSTTTLSYTVRRNEIDQTYSNETIDNRAYQVFTWVNAADSRSTGIWEELGWEGKILRAHIGVNYNGTRRQHRETNQVKTSTDWRAWADASLTLPKGWTVRADLNYRSDVATFFTLFKQYCTLNAHIQKRFKKVNVYLQGQDLLDNESTKEYISADQNEAWTETTRYNRRLVILGAQWNF